VREPQPCKKNTTKRCILHRRGIVALPAVREASVCRCSRAPVKLLLVPCRLLPKPTRNGKRGSCGCSFACHAAHLPTELERAVKLSDKDVEKKVREAAATGTLVELRVGFRDRTVRQTSLRTCSSEMALPSQQPSGVCACRAPASRASSTSR
jgi:hypothetical protein